MVLGLFILAMAWTSQLGAAEANSAPSRTQESAVEPTEHDRLSVEQLVEDARHSIVAVTHYGRELEEKGVGTGFIISSNGLIATCQHVIGEARPIRVRLTDGREFDVTAVHAWDRRLDLAIVQIDAENLPALSLGNSDALAQGAPIVALGNPVGLDLSVVRGILSARSEIAGQEMLQLAIPIEPGYSGGPVIDSQGRVQGILNMKSALTRNLGFAIPVNLLKPMIQQPSRVPIARWQTIGALNSKNWETLFGADWSQHGGVISVEYPGSGFGGRSLCLSYQEVPDRPYEVAVTVKLDDESGAAGLVFGSDGDQRHYGFYPSAGELRLTRFDGPTVFTWNILAQVQSPHYRPGDWNTIRVRREKDAILCYVNGHLVVESADEGLPDGRVGLAKFRHTQAQFKRFRVGRDTEEAGGTLPVTLAASIREAIAAPALSRDEDETLLASLQASAEAGRVFLHGEARRLEAEAGRLRDLARRVHERSIRDQLAEWLARPEAEIDLMKASLLVARLDNPELDVDFYLNQIDTMADEIRGAVASDVSQEALLRALRDYLFQENGFHGSRTDYYHQANSYVDRVLNDREGIPLTLSVIFLELADRIGLRNVHGVPMPGHFLVKHSPENGPEQLIDVYEGGKFVSRQDAEERILETAGMRLRESHLQPANKRDIVVRMLRNLQRIAEGNGALKEELKYQNVILALQPDSSVDRFQRAGLHLRNRDADAARRDLKWLLDHQPSGLDLERIGDIYRSLDTAQ